MKINSATKYHLKGRIRLEETEWGIAEFAHMFDITPRTIRFYEGKGLLSPRRDKGVRVFGPLDYTRLSKVMRAKRLGFTLDDIKEVLDVTDGHVIERSELLNRRKNFEKVIRGLDRRREDINALKQDMIEICQLLDAHLESLPKSGSVADMATAYDARLRQSLEDDFSIDSQYQNPQISQKNA